MSNNGDDGRGCGCECTCTLSICIPRVDAWVTDGYIRDVFRRVLVGGTEETGGGDGSDGGSFDPIEKVDLIYRNNEKGETYKRAFIHFNNWERLTSRAAALIWRKITEGETVKIMHAEPSYWKCSLNRVPRPLSRHAGQQPHGET